MVASQEVWQSEGVTMRHILSLCIMSWRVIMCRSVDDEMPCDDNKQSTLCDRSSDDRQMTTDGICLCPDDVGSGFCM